MKNHYLLTLSLFLGLVILLFSCKSDSEIIQEVDHTNYQIQPTKIYTDEEYAIISEDLDLPNLDLSSSANHFDFFSPDDGEIVRINTAKATLGKVLFYDKDLSIDYSTSCASCHQQENAFADNIALSIGANGNHTARNSLALGSFISVEEEYPSWDGGGTGGGGTGGTGGNGLFWDGRAEDFQAQMDETFVNPKEMGIDMEGLAERVNAKEYYRILAKQAYRTENITHISIKDALEEFMRTFHSTKSKFDIVIEEIGPNTSFSQNFFGFTASENLGKNLFEQNCSSCHGESIMPSQFVKTAATANNGLDLNYTDNGLGDITSIQNDFGKFKIPPLKNIAVTAPYMHDGRFENLEEVVNFYNNGIQAHSNLHPDLKNTNGFPKRLNLNNDEVKALVDFLETLTDENFISNKLFSNPFKS